MSETFFAVAYVSENGEVNEVGGQCRSWASVQVFKRECAGRMYSLIETERSRRKSLKKADDSSSLAG